MKLIILDHLRRWCLLWILILALQFLVAGFSLNSQEGQKALPIFFTQMAIFLGAFPLVFNLQKGIARTLLALPTTSRQIARAWWSVAVVIPAIAITGITTLAVIIFSCIEKQTVQQPELYVLACLMNALWLGAGFFILTGMPACNQTDWWSRTRGIIFGSLYGLSFSGGIFLFRDFSWANPTQTEIFMVVAAIATVAGWFRAEQMVLERGGFRLGNVTVSKKPGQYKAPASFGGLPFLWQTLSIRLGYMALAGVAWLLVMEMMMHGFVKLPPKQFIESMLPAFSSFGYFFIFQFLLLPMILQLRQLRTLPLSVSSLAATLVFVPIVPIFILGAVLSLVSGGLQINFLMFAAMLATAVPFFVWRGMKIGTYLVLMLLVMVSSLGGLKLLSIKAPVSVTVPVSACIIALAFEITRRLLQSSSNVYRTPSALTAGWGNVWSGGR